MPKVKSICLVTVKSSPRASTEICNQIIPKLEDNNYNPDDIFAIRLAIEEALLNAVKHGNRMDPSKRVLIKYSVNSEKTEIYVTDEGTGFNPDSIPDPRCGENLYKPDGRGLFLIRSYMDSVDFNKSGNQIHMVKHNSRFTTKKLTQPNL